MKRHGLIVLGLVLAFSGCAQNKGKKALETSQTSKVDALEANFTRFQEQQRARDADIDYKLRDIASRLDRLNVGQPPVPKGRKGPERKTVAMSSNRQPIVAGQIIPYDSLGASGQPRGIAPQTPPAATPQPAAVPQAQPLVTQPVTPQPQPLAAQPASPAPQPLPVLQPPVVTLGESYKSVQPVAPVQARRPVPVETASSGRERASSRSPQAAAPTPQAAPVAEPAASTAPIPSRPTASHTQGADMQEQLLYTEALRSVSANRNEEGRRKFNDFLAKYPNSAKTPEALFWIAESYMGDKSYNQAVLSFKEVTTRYPKDPKTEESLYRSADAYERLGDKANAILSLKLLITEHPNSEFAGKAKQKLKQLGQ